MNQRPVERLIVRERGKGDLSELVAPEFGNLDGFVIFDKSNRYQIECPRGW